MEQLVAQLVSLFFLIYGLLIVLGAPFGGPKKFANPFAKWVGKHLKKIAFSVLALPFKILKKIFSRKKERPQRRRRP